MLKEKSNNQIEIKENSLYEKEKENDENKKEEKKIVKQKGKKRHSKRFPMEKTVDETIEKINILLQNEVIYNF